MAPTRSIRMLKRYWIAGLVVIAVCAFVVAWLLAPRVDTSKVPTGITVPAIADRGQRVSPVLVAVGDIACAAGSDDARAAAAGRADVCQDGQTAALVAAQDPDVVLALGDLQYEDATLEEIRAGYDRSWGRFKDRTRPVPGNHEYQSDPAGYYEYFGTAAGDPTEGWYSYDVGGWHVVALNSNCADVGGCADGSAQHRWLTADLAAHQGTKCTLAYMHHPRFSSGPNGPAAEIDPLWEALVAGGADVLLVAHDHAYERYAPADARGERDDANGLRQFLVGTGGRNLYEIGDDVPLREAAEASDFGVLVLTLGIESYDWAFQPIGGKASPDHGRASCR